MNQREVYAGSGAPRCRSRNLAAAQGAILLGCCFWAMASVAHGEVLWQLGRFDESSAEFSPINDPITGQRRIDYANPAHDPIFVVGRDDPARQWFSYQPGTANGGAGFREHPFTLRFELPEVREGSYRLKLALLAYSTRLPVVKLALNGQPAIFHQEPKLAYSGGDHAVFFLPHYSTVQLVCPLPSHLLRRGWNELVLSAIDRPGDRDDVRPSGFPWPGCSGIHYDALALEHDSEPLPLDPVIGVTPTIFFRERNGRLFELVDVTVRLAGRPDAASISLHIGNWSVREPLRFAGAFGEERAAFEVPEFQAGTKARVTLEIDGRKHVQEVTLEPKRQWELLVVPNEHLDIGYTDFEWKVAELQSRTVDTAIEMVRANPDFRFTFDGYWIAEQFMRTRGPSQREEFLRLVRERKLFVPAVYGSAFTGFAALENLVRSLYPSREFARRYGGDFNCALITDVPSYSWSFASVLAAAGVTNLAAASDAYRGPFLLYNRLHERSPQWWEGPDGGRVLTWYSRHYHQIASLFGMPPQMLQGRDSLPRFLQAYEHPEYRASAAILYGTQVENVELHRAQATLAEEWNRVYAFPKLRYAGFAEAIEAIRRQAGDPLPVHRGDGGPYWEDGLGANARITALARENMHRAPAAEIFSTISALVDPRVAADRGRLERMWRQLLLTDEHTWHADQSTREPESEQSLRQGQARDRRTIEGQNLIDEHLGEALAVLGDVIHSPNRTLILFNALSWARRGWVEIDLPKGQSLFDLSSGDLVSHEKLSSGNSFDRVRFLSPEIPAVGYRSLAIRPSEDSLNSEEEMAGLVLENRFYRVTLEPGSGAVQSIRDKELDRELVDTSSPWRFGQHLYVTGADALPNRLVQYSTVSPEPKLEIHRAGGGKVRSVRRVPFGMVARLDSTNRMFPRIETEIVLPSTQKRIEVTVRVEKVRTYAKEGVYLAFPFAMPAPRFRYATQNGFVDPARDMLPGAGLEWFTVQQWIALQEDGFIAALAPVDAPLATFGDIARGHWPREFGHRPGTIFSYVMNNYTPEGYLAGQEGAFTFRHVITSGQNFDPAALHRLGMEALSPVERNEVTRNDKPFGARGTLPAEQLSFLEIVPEHVSLVTWKPAESGEGCILRFVEVAGRPARVTVKPRGPAIRAAALCNAVEDEQRPLPSSAGQFQFETGPFGITTVRMDFARDAGRR